MGDNHVMTRSLYIGGRDKAAEVAKRRELFEKEMEAKREAKLREQEEKMARIAKLKEIELKEKAKQKAEKEFKRQKEALDRRMKNLEEEKVKKEEILHKAHLNASRTSTSKKQVYAFGSRTPRELSYLEKLSKEQKEYNKRLLPINGFSDDQTIISKRNGMDGSASRLSTGPPINSIMTRSMYSPFSSRAIDSTPKLASKLPKKSPRSAPAATLIEKRKPPIKPPVTKPIRPSPTMTQSLYIPVKTNENQRLFAKQPQSNRNARVTSPVKKTILNRKEDAKKEIKVPVIVPGGKNLKHDNITKTIVDTTNNNTDFDLKDSWNLKSENHEQMEANSLETGVPPDMVDFGRKDEQNISIETKASPNFEEINLHSETDSELHPPLTNNLLNLSPAETIPLITKQNQIENEHKHPENALISFDYTNKTPTVTNDHESPNVNDKAFVHEETEIFVNEEEFKHNQDVSTVEKPKSFRENIAVDLDTIKVPDADLLVLSSPEEILPHNKKIAQEIDTKFEEWDNKPKFDNTNEENKSHDFFDDNLEPKHAPENNLAHSSSADVKPNSKIEQMHSETHDDSHDSSSSAKESDGESQNLSLPEQIRSKTNARQQERENRRNQLSQILSRTRTGGTVKVPETPRGEYGEHGSLLTNTIEEKKSKAMEFIAKRRMGKTGENSDSGVNSDFSSLSPIMKPQPKPRTLADELSDFQRNLPGQPIIQEIGYQPSRIGSKPEHEFEKERITPPEDPHVQFDYHPPEPRFIKN